jgi:hypothetical protein
MQARTQLDPQLRVLLRFFQMIALMGILIGLATLTRSTTPKVDTLQTLYLTWFTLSFVSVQAILYKIRAGVIVLVVSTAVVTLVELMAGVASIGGATLGSLVVFMIVVYVQPVWEEFD